MSANIDAGTFQVMYNESTECYEVSDELEGLESGPCRTIDDVLEFIRRNTWKPEDSQ